MLKKIAIFVDVQNIYYTCRQAYGRQFNYKELMRRVGWAAKIVQATAYAIARDDDGQRKFQDALRHMGFEVKLKPFIQRSDGSAKGDWDVGITIDVLDSGPMSTLSCCSRATVTLICCCRKYVKTTRRKPRSMGFRR